LHHPEGQRSRSARFTKRPAVDLDVGDLAALVLEVQGGAGRVFDNLRAVREAVNDLAVLDGLHQGGRGGLPLGAAGTGARTGHFPVGNWHRYLFSLSVSPWGASPTPSGF